MALGDGRVRGARRGTQGGGPVQKLKLGLTHGFERRLWFQIVKKKNCELKTIGFEIAFKTRLPFTNSTQCAPLYAKAGCDTNHGFEDRVPMPEGDGFKAERF